MQVVRIEQMAATAAVGRILSVREPLPAVPLADFPLAAQARAMPETHATLLVRASRVVRSVHEVRVVHAVRLVRAVHAARVVRVARVVRPKPAQEQAAH